MLRARLIDGQTLQAAGDRAGITRERARQLEVKLIGRATETLAPFVDDLLAFVEAFPRTVPMLLDRMQAPASGADEMVAATAKRVLRLQERCGYVTTTERWVELTRLLESAQLAGTSIDVAAARFASQMPADRALLEGLLSDAGYRVAPDGGLSPAHGTLETRLHELFETERRPLRKDEIDARLGLQGRQVDGLLARSAFRWVGKGLFAPTAWGMPTYRGTFHALIDAIRERGGTAKVDEVTEEVIARFGCTRVSCSIYLAGPRFTVVDGRVSLRGAAAIEEGVPARQRRVYDDLAGGFVYAIDVDEDVFRGSGSFVPGAVAARLGLTTDTPVTVPSPAGDLTVTFISASQNISSLRALALHFDAVVGDRLLLRLPKDGAPRWEHVERAHGIEGAARLVGWTGDGDPTTYLAGAVWTDDAELLEEALWDREETRILEALGWPEFDARRRSISVAKLEGVLKAIGASRNAIRREAGIADSALLAIKGGRFDLSSTSLTRLVRTLCARTGEESSGRMLRRLQ